MLYICCALKCEFFVRFPSDSFGRSEVTYQKHSFIARVLGSKVKKSKNIGKLNIRASD